MNHDPANQTAATPASKAASDKPLIIKDQQTTTGDLVINTTSDEAIQVTSTGRWQHEGNVDATGKNQGLFIDTGGIATINGNTTTHGKSGTGIDLSNRAHLTLNGDLEARGGTYNGVRMGLNTQVVVKGKTTIFGYRESSTGGVGYGLSLSSGAHWTSEGVLMADGKSAIAIEKATFNHHNDLTLQGKYSGLTMQGGLATINGNLTSQGETGDGLHIADGAGLTLNGNLEVKGGGASFASAVSIENMSQLSIKSQGKIAISSSGVDSTAKCLSVGNFCRFSSEGPMHLQSTQGTAMSMSNAEAFNHQGTLLVESNHSGISLSATLATMTGHTTVNSKKEGSLYLSKRGHLILNGPLEANAGTVGVRMSGNSQLMATEAVTVQTKTEAGIQLSEQSRAIFKGPTTIHAQRSYGIDLATDASWDSNDQLILESPNSTALTMKQASFKHQGSLTAQGKNGLQLAAGAVVEIQGSGEAVSEIVSEETALQVEAGSFNHQGQLTLTSQGQGMVLSKAGRAVVEGSLAINTPVEVAVQLDGAHWEHHGPLSLNGEHTIAIEGKTHTAGARSVLAITNASSASLKVDHPLTINNIMLANPGATQPQQAGSTVTLDSPQLSVKGVIDLASTAGGSLTLNGAGSLQLDEITCSPGSRLCINGNYQISIGKVTFQLDKVITTPPHLAFHLSANNRLQIGQFVLPATATPAPIIEIAGDHLDLYFDLKKVDLTAFPPGQHAYYQAEGQATPVQLINDASGCLKMPSSAQLTQALAAVDSLAARLPARDRSTTLPLDKPRRSVCGPMPALYWSPPPRSSAAALSSPCKPER